MDWYLVALMSVLAPSELLLLSLPSPSLLASTKGQSVKLSHLPSMDSASPSTSLLLRLAIDLPLPIPLLLVKIPSNSPSSPTSLTFELLPSPQFRSNRLPLPSTLDHKLSSNLCDWRVVGIASSALEPAFQSPPISLRLLSLQEAQIAATRRNASQWPSHLPSISLSFDHPSRPYEDSNLYQRHFRMNKV